MVHVVQRAGRGGRRDPDSDTGHGTRRPGPAPDRDRVMRDAVLVKVKVEITK